jgi:hypothetical protein
MLRNITRIYAQGGQVADPSKHIFGLANSPKVKNLCIRDCTDPQLAVWKTLLVMPEGYGNYETFVLDITNPLSEGGFAEPPVAPLWHTEDAFLKGTYDEALGQTISVPAFFFNKTETLDDHRLIFASGYKPEPNVGPAAQGRQLVVASAGQGTIAERYSVPAQGGCAQEFTVASDIATARDYARDQRQKLLGAYFGDTWGGLWRYTNGPPSLVTRFSCEEPLHFAPTVIQLDRDDSSNRPHETYLVQVTNSAMDEDTIDFATPSKMIIMKEMKNAEGQVIPDPSFGVGGRMVVAAGNDSLCARTNGSGRCNPDDIVPARARPMGTPMGLLKRDGSGFMLMSLWYVPDAVGCTKGKTYMALHELVGQTLTQKQGLEFSFAQEPIASVVVVNGRLYVVSSQGLRNIAGDINATFVTGTAQSPRAGLGAGRFTLSGWTEM